MKKEMTGGTKITLIISGAAMLAGIVIVVLFAAGALALSEQSRNVLAIAISAALVVFSYTLCKSLGVLKNQKSDSHPPRPRGERVKGGYSLSRKRISPF